MIDEKKLVEDIHKFVEKHRNDEEIAWTGFDWLIKEDSIIEIINSQPTAYDVDKMIEQISSKMFSAECYNDDFNGCEIKNLLCMGDVYEILKGEENHE